MDECNEKGSGVERDVGVDTALQPRCEGNGQKTSSYCKALSKLLAAYFIVLTSARVIPLRAVTCVVPTEFSQNGSVNATLAALVGVFVFSRFHSHDNAMAMQLSFCGGPHSYSCTVTTRRENTRATDRLDYGFIKLKNSKLLQRPQKAQSH